MKNEGTPSEGPFTPMLRVAVRPRYGVSALHSGAATCLTSSTRGNHRRPTTTVTSKNCSRVPRVSRSGAANLIGTYSEAGSGSGGVEQPGSSSGS